MKKLPFQGKRRDCGSITRKKKSRRRRYEVSPQKSKKKENTAFCTIGRYKAYKL